MRIKYHLEKRTLRRSCYNRFKILGPYGNVYSDFGLLGCNCIIWYLDTIFFFEENIASRFRIKVNR